jgi:hypothetical protein
VKSRLCLEFCSKSVLSESATLDLTLLPCISLMTNLFYH